MKSTKKAIYSIFTDLQKIPQKFPTDDKNLQLHIEVTIHLCCKNHRNGYLCKFCNTTDLSVILREIRAMTHRIKYGPLL